MRNKAFAFLSLAFFVLLMSAHPAHGRFSLKNKFQSLDPDGNDAAGNATALCGVNMIFIVDKSGSMRSHQIPRPGQAQPTTTVKTETPPDYNMGHIRQALTQLVKSVLQIQPESRFGLVTFSDNARVEKQLGVWTESQLVSTINTAVRNPGGLTNHEDALRNTLGMLRYRDPRFPVIVVMMTDGATTVPEDRLNKARVMNLTALVQRRATVVWFQVTTDNPVAPLDYKATVDPSNIGKLFKVLPDFTLVQSALDLVMKRACSKCPKAEVYVVMDASRSVTLKKATTLPEAKDFMEKIIESTKKSFDSSEFSWYLFATPSIRSGNTYRATLSLDNQNAVGAIPMQDKPLSEDESRKLITSLNWGSAPNSATDRRLQNVATVSFLKNGKTQSTGTMGDCTMTGLATQYMAKSVLAPLPPKGENAGRFLILITDGAPDDGEGGPGKCYEAVNNWSRDRRLAADEAHQNVTIRKAAVECCLSSPVCNPSLPFEENGKNPLQMIEEKAYYYLITYNGVSEADPAYARVLPQLGSRLRQSFSGSSLKEISAMLDAIAQQVSQDCVNSNSLMP